MPVTVPLDGLTVSEKLQFMEALWENWTATPMHSNPQNGPAKCGCHED